VKAKVRVKSAFYKTAKGPLFSPLLIDVRFNFKDYGIVA